MRRWSKDCLVLLKQAAKNCEVIEPVTMQIKLTPKNQSGENNNKSRKWWQTHSELSQLQGNESKVFRKKCVVLPKSAHQKSAEVNSIRMACHQFKIFEPAVFRAQNKDGAELREEAHWPQQIMACQATKR